MNRHQGEIPRTMNTATGEIMPDPVPASAGNAHEVILAAVVGKWPVVVAVVDRGVTIWLIPPGDVHPSAPATVRNFVLRAKSWAWSASAKVAGCELVISHEMLRFSGYRPEHVIHESVHRILSAVLAEAAKDADSRLPFSKQGVR